MIGTYRPTARVLAVLELLQAHGQLSGADLAARLEVDRRTVRRYITTLQDLGIPVEAERGSYGGYRLRPGFKLPPLMFNDDEALAVTLGLLAHRRLALAGSAQAAESALAKVERVLPAALREQVGALVSSLDIALPARDGPAPDGATILTLGAATHDRRRLRLRYRSRHDQHTERDVDPYGLVVHERSWYLVGWDHLRADLRVFRVDRILDVALRDETFSRPADFRALDHVIRTMAGGPWRWDVEVLLETSFGVAREQVSPWQATLEETPEGVVLYARAESLAGMARWLVSIGAPFVVRRPAELRTELRRLAERVAEQASRSPLRGRASADVRKQADHRR